MAVTNTTFLEGNLLLFSVTFTDEATGNPINPTEVAFGYRVNGGQISIFEYGVAPSVKNPSTGTYTIEIDSTNLPGTWVWEWQSKGTGQALTSGAITVAQAAMSLI